MSDAKKPILYTYYRSSAGWRVRLMLEYKGIEYETRSVNLLKNEQTEEAFATINPNRKVPVFITADGKTLTQSIAILEYLEETHPESPLLPKDPYERAKVRELAFEIACDIHPIQNNGIMKAHAPDNPEEQVAWAARWITRGFEAIEKRLAQYGGKYCIGDTLTMADLCLAPQYYNAIRYKVDLTRFPNINRVVENLLALPEFKKTHPDTIGSQ